MSKKTDVDELSQLPLEELDTRMKLCGARIETRAQRCEAENRDLSDRELDLCNDDKLELSALNDALALRRRNAESRERLGMMLDQAVEARSAPWTPSLLVSQRHLEEHAEALHAGRPYGAVELETRSRMTAASDLGSAAAWNPGSPNEPRHLINFAGIPVSQLNGRTAQVPAYTGPTAAAGVDEDTDHGEYDAVAPIDLTALRYGRWSDVSALANVVDDLVGLNRMHSWGIARDLDALAVAAVEGAAGWMGVSVDIEQQVRQAILTVAAAVYSDETELVVFGTPADLAELVATSPTNGGDVGSYSVRFNGAKLYPTTAASTDVLTVFAPSAFRVFQAPLQSASLIDPTDGSHKFGSWMHSTSVACQIVGAAVTVGAS